ncbi:hypothetical protein [Natronorubrum sulfidifaciens]|uniref:Pyridoxamine 5'-phosphate oxidase-like FMN-binding protein n=1 Tax=Natronorubrum sulfidifaciens JCM 14089 TaxID=1230460 RepID=L9W4Z3_9EURY|nr:hypothetical protein [Natronorubrum sulfidifaciens]ELY44524.1 hypothetical protein C495_11504 [Natronorubrum sulfidifaciens JCM 14089]
MHVRGTLSPSAITDLLEETTAPIRVACRTPQDNLWMCSLWYRLEDGAAEDDWQLQCATSAGADIVSFLESEPEVAFEVSTNEPPYTGVRGRGTATVEPDPEKEALRALLERYHVGTASELARNLLSEERDEVTITIAPAVVYGWDFADRM